MKQKVPVSSIMTKEVIKLNLSDDLTKAETLFKKHHILKGVNSFQVKKAQLSRKNENYFHSEIDKQLFPIE